MEHSNNPETVKYAPFDPSIVAFDSAGREVRFVKSPLDEKYLVTPGPYKAIRSGMIPPEEFDVAKALILYRLALEDRERLGFWGVISSWLSTKRAKAIQDGIDSTGTVLKTVIAQSPAHRAAFKRMYHALEEFGDAQKILGSFLA